MRFDKFYAVVTNTDDPEKRGRIKAKSDNLLSEDIEIPYWIEPRFHFVTKTGGFFGVPEFGSMVEIEMAVSTKNDELPDISSLTPAEIRYVCTTFNDVQELHKIFSTNYPLRIGWAFPGGWVIYVDTKDGSIFLGYLGSGTTPKSWIMIEADTIAIETDQGFRVKMDPSSLLVESDAGQRIKFEAAQILVESDSVPINVAGPFINIGGALATDFIAKGTTLIAGLTVFFTGWLAAITTWIGIPPLDPGAIAYLTQIQTVLIPAIQTVLGLSLSVKHKVE